MLIEEIDYGSTENAQPTDYKPEKLPTPPFIYASHNIQYNQNDVCKYSCTVSASIGAISDLTGYEFTLTERLELWDEAVKLGANPEQGWSVSEAVKLVSKYWNSKHDKKVLYFRVDRLSTDFWRAIDAGYSCVVNYRGNSKYQTDKSDGRLDGETFGIPTFGHIVRTHFKDKDLEVVDNYKGSKSNTYLIADDHWEHLQMFGASAYFFVIEDDYRKANEIYQEIPSWGEVAKQKSIAKGIITDWTNPDEIVAGERVEFMLEKLNLLDSTQHKGGVSLLRFAIALDRLKLLN